MSRCARRLMVWVLALTLVAAALASAGPEGQLTSAVHFTLAPTLFEPAETPGIVSPFMILYALHDALVKPMPGQSMAPSLAESWSASPDGLAYAYGAYPDIDALFREQTTELDPKKREALLHRIQQLIYDKAMYLPLLQLAALSGYGPRVAESGLGLIVDYPWVAPYEEVKLKAR